MSLSLALSSFYHRLATDSRTLYRAGMWTSVLVMVAAVAAFFPELAFLWQSRGCEVHGYVKIPLDLPGKSMCLPSHMVKGSSLDAFIPIIFAPIVVELFSEVGDLKRYAVHYDRSGRSKGTAEVVFSRRGDGLAAVKRYNNVELDGKPMKIEIVGTNVAAMGALPPVFNGLVRNPPGPRSGQGRGGAMGRIRGGRGSGSGSGRGRGRGRGRDEKASVSVDDLDADLDKYHSEAMQTN
uniref:RRM domain-containing protein n=1 Tax=Chenopodium quinoa TaxID=63459 RepID=A0A803LCM1_CHEQI